MTEIPPIPQDQELSTILPVTEPDKLLPLPPGDKIPVCPYCNQIGMLSEWIHGYPQFCCDHCNVKFFVPDLRSKCSRYPQTIVADTCKGCPMYKYTKNPAMTCAFWVGVVEMPKELKVKVQKHFDYQRKSWGAKKVA